MRLELNLNYARSQDGVPRAAARLTVRARHEALATGLTKSIAARWGGVAAPLP